MSDVVLAIVDVQRAFLDPTLGGLGKHEKAFCVPGVRRMIKHARTRGWKIVHVGTQHEGTGTLPTHQARLGIEPYCLPGTPGIEFVVEPETEEFTVYKDWYSAFASDFSQILGGESTIVWTGVATDCCISQSAFEADRHGLTSVVPIEAVSASSKDAFRSGLLSLSKSAADIVILEQLESFSPPDRVRFDANQLRLNVDEIRQYADAWYDKQEAQLKALGTKRDLDSVLEALG